MKKRKLTKARNSKEFNSLFNDGTVYRNKVENNVEMGENAVQSHFLLFRPFFHYFLSSNLLNYVFFCNRLIASFKKNVNLIFDSKIDR